MVLFVLWILLGEGRRASVRKKSLAHAAAGLVVLLGTASVHAAPAPGVDKYSAGEYQSALETFEKESASSPDKDKLQFNAGASAYKLGDYAKSIDYFTGALLSSDASLRDRVGYNLANALVRRGEGAKSKEAKVSDWKDAIKHYDSVLERQPNNTQARENRDLVKKMLEDLEKEDPKQDQQQDQNKKDDQQNQDQKNQDQQKQDQDKKDDQQDQKDDQQKQDQKSDSQQDQKDGEKGDQKDPKNQDSKDGDSKDQKPEDKGDPKDKDGQKGDEKDSQNSKPEDGEGEQQGSQERNQGGQPTPQPTPGEQKQGDLKANPDEKASESEPAGEPEAEEREGEMSEAQARSLLRSMEGEEDKVELRQQRTYQDVLRDW
jgi:Ca-activated chloride channel family protein